MRFENKFIWGLISGTTGHYVGHLIDDASSDLCYCGKPKSQLINRVYSFKIIEGINRSLCTSCQTENKRRLAKHYKIRGWIQ